MFSLLLCVLSIQIMVALAAPPLGIIMPTSVAGTINIGSSPFNSTRSSEADASVAALHSTQASHIPLFNLSRNATIQDVEDVEYAVPGTDTTLQMSFRRDRPLQRRALGGYLLLMQDEISTHVAQSGDGWLLPADDPYKRDWPRFYFIAKSSPLPIEAGVPHLTYGMLNDALKDIMYVGAPNTGPLPFGCYCFILDGAEDLVGTVVIWAGPVNIEDA